MKAKTRNLIEDYNHRQHEIYRQAPSSAKPRVHMVSDRVLEWSLLIQFLTAQDRLVSFLDSLENWIEYYDRMYPENDAMITLSNNMAKVIPKVMGGDWPMLSSAWCDVLYLTRRWE